MYSWPQTAEHSLFVLPLFEYTKDHIRQRHQFNLDHVPTKWIAPIKRKSVLFSQLKNGKCPCLSVFFSLLLLCVCFARLFVLLLVIVVDIVIWLNAVAAITLPTISDKCFMLLVSECMCATTIVYIRLSHKLTMPLRERERERERVQSRIYFIVSLVSTRAVGFRFQLLFFVGFSRFENVI